ncbi:2-haloacid dehalogenase [Albimonas donghaensis]|uniref:(S)-2-haloacid dehalogenase n=1 Tax=Albimonas donghaensis TaxID=356660 RepID=A0A1H3G102_9RHOB|nr:haloacid dehalogenase type II [Albimonas donghaensis]SDX96029.1 2-haloacid dehalogenase [Albimonas donghaensis]
MPIATCVFDAYGTLFDVAAAARRLAADPAHPRFAEAWPRIAEIWRLKQLQYSWLRATAGVHTDFWQVTVDALDYALEAVGGVASDERQLLLDLYFELDAYPEVPSMLAALKEAGLETAILSNGSPAMLNGAVRSAGLEAVLDEVLSVESVGVFKPARVVYDLVGHTFGRTPREVLFVSSNGWDAAAAAGYGFRTVWVNRNGDPLDRLPWTPQKIAEDLRVIPELAATW